LNVCTKKSKVSLGLLQLFLYRDKTTRNRKCRILLFTEKCKATGACFLLLKKKKKELERSSKIGINEGRGKSMFNLEIFFS
jgi:hypothetical protein